MISIRKERPPDVAAREALLDDAFGGQRWRKSSQRLRDGRSPAEGLAFIATDGTRVVGTARLWNIVSGTGKPALLLGPVAVAADFRNHGIARRWCAVHSAWHVDRVTARSSSSATRPTMAASASPPRKLRPCACPVHSSASACSVSNWCRGRSTGCAGSCARPAGPFSPQSPRRRPNQPSKIPWTPDGLLPGRYSVRAPARI